MHSCNLSGPERAVPAAGNGGSVAWNGGGIYRYAARE